VKNKEARDVPLHEHIIAQGFLEWVRERGDGPLFYRPRRPQGAERSATKVKKSPAAQARQRLASWIRELGITDTELMPNHAWRHTFKLRGRRAGVSDKYLDDICGHAPPSEGRTYAPTPLEDKATAIARFPRYET
jgi:integrase